MGAVSPALNKITSVLGKTSSLRGFLSNEHSCLCQNSKWPLQFQSVSYIVLEKQGDKLRRLRL